MSPQPRKMTGLAAAMNRSGGTVAGVTPPAPAPEAPAVTTEQPTPAARAAGTPGLVPLTVRTTEAVRRQLKALAAEQGRPMEDVTAEALNLLFAKYRKSEIAPRKAGI